VVFVNVGITGCTTYHLDRVWCSIVPVRYGRNQNEMTNPNSGTPLFIGLMVGVVIVWLSLIMVVRFFDLIVLH